MENNGTDFAFLKNETAQKAYTSATYGALPQRGLNESVIERISTANRDPSWLRDLRYAAFDAFNEFSEPSPWAPDLLSELDLDDPFTTIPWKHPQRMTGETCPIRFAKH